MRQIKKQNIADGEDEPEFEEDHAVTLGKS